MSAVPSPNIWNHPDVYEVENEGVDPDGVIVSAMRGHHDWAGAHVLDVGCGSGFHLPRFAETASRVIGVEPHRSLVEAARVRVAGLSHVAVREGLAQELPVTDASIDVAHAHWAYFFGPGCEPGLEELGRVMRPGGTAFVVDVDAGRSTFGSWFRREWPGYDPDAVERFWRRHGWTSESLLIRWGQPDRERFEACVGIEFSPRTAASILAEHEGTEVDYAVALRRRTF